PVEVTHGPGPCIRGKVVRADGTGAEGYRVRALSPGSRGAGFPGGSDGPATGADGAFSIDGLRAGDSYDLVAIGPRRGATRREGVSAPTEGVEIALPSPGRIAGRVLDAQTLSPVPDFQVDYEADRSSGGGGFGRIGAGRRA